MILDRGPFTPSITYPHTLSSNSRQAHLAAVRLPLGALPLPDEASEAVRQVPAVAPAELAGQGGRHGGGHGGYAEQVAQVEGSSLIWGRHVKGYARSANKRTVRMRGLRPQYTNCSPLDALQAQQLALGLSAHANQPTCCTVRHISVRS